jgi:hypothetical protein
MLYAFLAAAIRRRLNTRQQNLENADEESKMLITMMHPGVSEAHLHVMIFFRIRKSINSNPAMNRAKPETTEAT